MSISRTFRRFRGVLVGGLVVATLTVAGTYVAHQAGPVQPVIQTSVGAAPSWAFPAQLTGLQHSFRTFEAPTGLPSVTADQAALIACDDCGQWRAWLIDLDRPGVGAQTSHAVRQRQLVWVVGTKGHRLGGAENGVNGSRYSWFVFVDAATGKSVVKVAMAGVVEPA